MAVGFNVVTLLGTLDMLGTIGLLAAAIGLTLASLQQRQPTLAVIYILSGIVSPILLFLVGAILSFQGWRVDPVVGFAILLLHLIVVLGIVKDIILITRRPFRS